MHYAIACGNEEGVKLLLDVTEEEVFKKPAKRKKRKHKAKRIKRAKKNRGKEGKLKRERDTIDISINVFICMLVCFFSPPSIGQTLFHISYDIKFTL